MRRSSASAQRTVPETGPGPSASTISFIWKKAGAGAQHHAAFQDLLVRAAGGEAVAGAAGVDAEEARAVVEDDDLDRADARRGSPRPPARGSARCRRRRSRWRRAPGRGGRARRRRRCRRAASPTRCGRRRSRWRRCRRGSTPAPVSSALRTSPVQPAGSRRLPPGLAAASQAAAAPGYSAPPATGGKVSMTARAAAALTKAPAWASCRPSRCRPARAVSPVARPSAVKAGR